MRPISQHGVCILIILLATFFSTAAPAQIKEILKEHQTLLEKKLDYFSGKIPETEMIEYGWPRWKPSREEGLCYPFQRVETVAGTLVSHGYESCGDILWLDDKALVENSQSTVIKQAYPEKEGKPAIIIVSLDLIGRPTEKDDIPAHYYLVDVGISPPFISKEALPISNTLPNEDACDIFGRTPCDSHIKIQKINDDIYLFSGTSFVEKDKDGKPLYVTYKYDRKTRTITKIE